MNFPSKINFSHGNKTKKFLLWPGLTSSSITNHFITPTSTLMGHIKQKKQGLRSAKPPYKPQSF